MIRPLLSTAGNLVAGCWLLFVLAASVLRTGILEWAVDHQYVASWLNNNDGVGSLLLGLVVATFVLPAYLLELAGVGAPLIEVSRPQAYGFPTLRDPGVILVYGLPTIVLALWVWRGRWPNNSLQGARHVHLWLALLGAIVLARP